MVPRLRILNEGVCALQGSLECSWRHASLCKGVMGKMLCHQCWTRTDIEAASCASHWARLSTPELCTIQGLLDRL